MTASPLVAGVFTTAAPHAVDPDWQHLVSEILLEEGVPYFIEPTDYSTDSRFRGFVGRPEGYDSVVEANLRLVYLTSLQDVVRFAPPAFTRLRHQMHDQPDARQQCLNPCDCTVFCTSALFWRECLDYGSMWDSLSDRTIGELSLLLQIGQATNGTSAVPLGTAKDIETAARSLGVLAKGDAGVCQRELLGLTPDKHWPGLTEALEPHIYPSRL